MHLEIGRLVVVVVVEMTSASQNQYKRMRPTDESIRNETRPTDEIGMSGLTFE
jgi:hypothetical protein